MGREHTDQEITDSFMRQLVAYINYWAEIDNRPAREKLEGLTHSILCILDGCSAALPGFIVAPVTHPDDKKYHQDEGENWYPENHEIEEQLKGVLPGHLHELLYTYIKEE